MKQPTLFNMLILSSILLWACGTGSSDNELEDAYEYHKSSIEVRERIGEKLKNRESDSPGPLELEALKERLHEWDQNFVEVPGFEHEHHQHEHGHHHHHNPAPNLTPSQHLNLQKGLLEEIMEIEIALKND